MDVQVEQQPYLNGSSGSHNVEVSYRIQCIYIYIYERNQDSIVLNDFFLRIFQDSAQNGKRPAGNSNKENSKDHKASRSRSVDT